MYLYATFFCYFLPTLSILLPCIIKFLIEIPVDNTCNNHMDKENKRHPLYKIPMLCLVPEGIHPRPGTGASAQQAEPK